jgi:hypothetical protein
MVDLSAHELGDIRLELGSKVDRRGQRGLRDQIVDERDHLWRIARSAAHPGCTIGDMASAAFRAPALVSNVMLSTSPARCWTTAS